MLIISPSFTKEHENITFLFALCKGIRKISEVSATQPFLVLSRNSGRCVTTLKTAVFQTQSEISACGIRDPRHCNPECSSRNQQSH